MGDPFTRPEPNIQITTLIRLKVLPKAHREDADALQAAALDGAG